MSFSKEQKALILSQPMKAVCCRRALLEGVISARGFIENGRIILSLDNAETISFLSEMIYEVFSKQPDINTAVSGGRRRLLSFESKAAERYLLTIEKDGISFASRCAVCQSAFLKGMFLACGRISDPSKQYSLELSIGNRAEAFKDYFCSIGLSPKIAYKQHETLVYFRNSSYLEDYLALAGMNGALFALMEEKIQRDIRNNTNRVVNCETNNIERAVSASIGQITLIQELIDTGLISLLPEELQHTARFRMENKDMSLSQMAGAITPPVSKSGLSHRLKKITEMAKEILKKNENK